MIVGFPPIIADQARVMILGSMPSVTSLEKQEYYGFSHNRFWKIMNLVYHMPIDNYEQKKQIIYHNQLILWDVIASCEREGSLDSDIRQEIVNPIDELIMQYSITKVICNGRKSYDLYQKHFKELPVICCYLPSTSNANRSIKEDVLIQQWVQALKAN